MIAADRACRLRDAIRDIMNRAQLLVVYASEALDDPDSAERRDRLDVAAYDTAQAIQNWEAMHGDD